MNKNINDLNISKENKILITKIEKKISVLSNEIQEYFDSSLLVSSKSIKDAFSNNEDLLKILNMNNIEINEIKNDFNLIRNKYQIDFDSEYKSEEYDDKLNIVKNTISSRTQLVNSEKKMFVLNKRIKYLDIKTKKRKNEMNKHLKSIEKKINDTEIINTNLLKEDLSLIKNYIDEKKLLRKRFFYYLPIIFTFISMVLVGAMVWKMFY